MPVDPASVEVEQVWYPSKDGTRIPMFLVHKKGLQRDGEQPDAALRLRRLQHQRDAELQRHAVPWLERGGVYALPNLRGGGEYGEDWHQAGMLAQASRTCSTTSSPRPSG